MSDNKPFIDAERLAEIRKSLEYRLSINSYPISDDDLVAVLDAYDSQATRIAELERKLSIAVPGCGCEIGRSLINGAPAFKTCSKHSFANQKERK